MYGTTNLALICKNWKGWGDIDTNRYSIHKIIFDPSNNHFIKSVTWVLWIKLLGDIELISWSLDFGWKYWWEGVFLYFLNQNYFCLRIFFWHLGTNRDFFNKMYLFHALLVNRRYAFSIYIFSDANKYERGSIILFFYMPNIWVGRHFFTLRLKGIFLIIFIYQKYEEESTLFISFFCRYDCVCMAVGAKYF